MYKLLPKFEFLLHLSFLPRTLLCASAVWPIWKTTQFAIGTYITSWFAGHQLQNCLSGRPKFCHVLCHNIRFGAGIRDILLKHSNSLAGWFGHTSTQWIYPPYASRLEQKLCSFSHGWRRKRPVRECDINGSNPSSLCPSHKTHHARTPKHPTRSHHGTIRQLYG